jgi:hypothetical protein
VRAQELKRLGDGSHGLGCARDLLLELVEGVHPLGMLSIGETLDEDLKLLLQLLIFLVLKTMRALEYESALTSSSSGRP